MKNGNSVHKIKDLLNFPIITEYLGTLELYFESGMECLGLVHHDFRGVTFSPSYNENSKTFDGAGQEFHSIEWTSFLENGDELEVYNQDGSVLWRGILFNDEKKMIEHRHNFSFIQLDIPVDDWISWFKESRKARLWKKEKIDSFSP